MPGKPGIINITGMRGRRKGGLPPAVSTPPRPESLAAGVAAFLENLSARAYSKGSVEAHHWALRGFLEWSDGQGLTSAAAFTRATVEEFQIHLHHYRSPRTKEPLGVNTQLGRLGCVRRLFAWLCRTGTIPANPAADLDLPRKQARRLPKALSPEEIDRLFSLPNPADPMGLRDRAILELFYATGIRRTEMTELDPGDYDPDSRTLLIRHGKGDKSRLLPVGGRAAFWLDRYLAEARPLFDHQPNETALFLSGYGTRITPAYLGNWVAGQMKRVGITKPGACHLFRHSCATDMHLGGADIRYVQEMLGHARLETTQIYTHVNIAALAGVHARTHPHGLLPNDHEHGFREAVVLDPAPEDPEPTLDSEVPDDFACGPEAEVLPVASDMPTSLANPIPAPRMVPEPPGGEDNPPEAGPPAPPKRPPPPSPWNPPNPLASNALQQDDKSSPGAHVAYYGYRYYHPDLGRWISRDPIGESGGLNLYRFLRNTTTSLDIYGLSVTEDNACVRRAAAAYKKNADLIKRIRKIKTCSEPLVYCGCCDGSEYAIATGGDPRKEPNTEPLPRSIKVCTNSVKGMSDSRLEITLRHEMIHALQFCLKDKVENCDDSVCREIESYYNSECANLTDPTLRKACTLGKGKDDSIGGVIESSKEYCHGDMKKLLESFHRQYDTCKNKNL